MVVLKYGSKGNLVKCLQRIIGINDDGIFGKQTEEAVKNIQAKYNLSVDGIVGNNTWNALGINQDYLCSRRIDKIIIHCTATKPKQSQTITVNDIKQWHLQRGFSDIGYHFVIYTDGSIHTGRDINKAGAHCTGQNSYSIGITTNSGLDEKGNPVDTRTEQQKASLLTMLLNLKKIYPNATIHGHNEFAAKACPCYNVQKQYGYLNV